jgi:hypothetical protein
MLTDDLRAQLVYALRDDLIGPDADDPRDAAHQTESLSSSPAHWYMTGFLAPTGQATEEKEDPEAGEDLDSALEGPEEGEADAPVASRRPVFPSSLGLSLLVRPEATALQVRVTYGTYAPGARAASDLPPKRQASSKSEPPPEGDGALRFTWTRTPHDRRVVVALDGEPKHDVPVPGSEGLVLRVVVRKVPENELPLVPPGTRYVTLFLVNHRKAFDRPEQDRGYIFQTRFEVTCASGFIARPNLRGARSDDDIDEKVGDLQYRDAREFVSGHGISTEARVTLRDGEAFCDQIATCWVPMAEVEKVAPATVDDVMLEMDALAQLGDKSRLRPAVGALVTAYKAWLAEQGETKLDTDTRRDTAASLLHAGRRAGDRIEAGIVLLETDTLAFEAFCTANKAMAAAAWQRNRKTLEAKKQVPKWRPFQLAFLLMSVAAQMDPAHGDREVVDLIFFPTGGGKTEAYLGLAAFTLLIRRLRKPGLASAGVTVLMRYTLRLLTLDQLERAATLVCALEIERRADPERYGPHRFSIGLWVGKAATPNRFGTEKDRDESTARNRTLAFAKDPTASPSPIPIDKCPWCEEPFSNDTFRLLPDSRAPTELRVLCTSPRCAFRSTKAFPEGLPVVGVDDELYRELPCFLIATVDKFAALPWVGKTGLLLGKNVTHHNDHGFYGPGAKPPSAKTLPAPLLPPDLIIQDELHLISGPLGTMVGLYETAIDHLTTRTVNGKKIRPKIVASTATVRRANAQIRALFGRTKVDVFPPPGPNRRTSFFAETVPTPAPDRDPKTTANARLYIALAAPGRSQKVLLMRAYIVLLAAAKKAFDADPAAADPYMTLVGYFNSLRELGGSQRIVEDEVRQRLARIRLRHRVGEASTTLVDRTIAMECVELTSRRSTDAVKEAKARLDEDFLDTGAPGKKKKKHAPVDVALASNMISVGVDIQRLGLMVVCGQPKTNAEYIQATSRVGRDDKRPGLVVTLLNVHKPRDRSHYEHFATFHESFYRGVEATSVTPFSPRALDRGIVGVALALARLDDARLTPADGAEEITAVRGDLGFVGEVFAARAEAHRESHADDDPIDEVKAGLRARIESLLDSWACVVRNDPSRDGLAYQKFEEGQASKRPLLHMPLDADLVGADQHERRFVANRSMRDVEGSVDVYVMKLKESAVTLADALAGESQ